MIKVHIKQEQQFSKDKYEGEGIYHNLITDAIVAVSDKSEHIFFLGEYKFIGYLFERIEEEAKAKIEELQTKSLYFESVKEEQKQSEGMVSETFALKAIAMLTNKKKLRKYEI